jgi:hypothetical protein
MSNAERQALFQKRHPGYDARRKARQRAAEKRAVAMAAEPLALPEPAASPVSRAVLMLPAPAVVPVLPGMNTIERTPAAAEPQLLLFPAMRPAA